MRPGVQQEGGTGSRVWSVKNREKSHQPNATKNISQPIHSRNQNQDGSAQPEPINSKSDCQHRSRSNPSCGCYKYGPALTMLPRLMMKCLLCERQAHLSHSPERRIFHICSYEALSLLLTLFDRLLATSYADVGSSFGWFDIVRLSHPRCLS